MDEQKSYNQGHNALFCFALIMLLLSVGYFVYSRYETLQRLERYVHEKKQDYQYVDEMLGCLRKKSIFFPLPMQIENCMNLLSADQTKMVRYRIEYSFQLASTDLPR